MRLNSCIDAIKGERLSLLQRHSMTVSSTHMDPGAARANSSGSSRALPVVVATVCFLMGFTGRGLLESFVVFLLPLSTEFSLDRASAVSIYALSVLAAGTAGPLVGRLFDRAGPRARSEERRV